MVEVFLAAEDFDGVFDFAAAGFLAVADFVDAVFFVADVDLLEAAVFGFAAPLAFALDLVRVAGVGSILQTFGDHVKTCIGARAEKANCHPVCEDDQRGAEKNTSETRCGGQEDTGYPH